MALADRISIDTTGMTTEKRDALLKGLAYVFDVKNPDQTLDISGAGALNTSWKNKVAEILVVWAKRAQKYERDLVASDIDISDA